MTDIPHPNNVQWGRIVREGGWSYQITPRDACTLSISTKGEDLTAPEYIIWCYVQRLAAYGSSSRTLHKIVKWHSQPINPIWAWPNDRNLAVNVHGGLAAPWRNRANRIYQQEQRLPDNRRTYTSTAQLQRRRQNIATLNALIAGDENIWRTQVPGNIKLAVHEVLTGQVGNMCPGYTDFANEVVTRRHRDRRVPLGGGIRPDGRRTPRNYFIEAPSLRGRSVRIISPSGESSVGKRRRNFPPRNFTALGDEGADLAVAAAQQENIPEDQTSESRASGQPSPNPENNVRITASSVPDAGEQTVQRYNVLNQHELRQSIDDWANEIEELLTTVDPV